MKRNKNLLFTLAAIVFLFGAMSVTKASAAPVVSVKYDEEYITIAGADKQVYYQEIKKADAATKLKATNWIPAAVKDDVYYIDFSATSNTKDVYFAWTTDVTAEAGTVITVDAKVKSLKVNLNYATEVVNEGLDEIISKVTVKGVDKSDDKTDIAPDKYAFLWKRGANGTWGVETSFTQLEWSMIKASNATLYISVAGGDGDKAEPVAYAYRPSKETKVKIPKAAKAPSVKVDFTKGTVALKNGMQVREAGKEAWLNVSPYSKTEAKNSEVFSEDATVVTKAKVSSVVVSELIAALKSNAGVGNEIKLEVRTAATDKKFPSNIATVSFKTPPAACAVISGATFIYTFADKNAKVAADFTIDFAKILTGVENGKYNVYEYVFAKEAKDEVDFSKQKWTKLPADGKVNLASKLGREYKYTKKDGTTVAAKYEETTTVYVRKVADKENGLFPSRHATVTIKPKEIKAYAITVTENAVVNVSYKVGEGSTLKAKKGELVAVTCKVAEGYENLQVTVMNGDAAVSGEWKDNVYTFTMPDGDVTITTAVTKKQSAAGGDAQGAT